MNNSTYGEENLDFEMESVKKETEPNIYATAAGDSATPVTQQTSFEKCMQGAEEKRQPPTEHEYASQCETVVLRRMLFVVAAVAAVALLIIAIATLMLALTTMKPRNDSTANEQDGDSTGVKKSEDYDTTDKIRENVTTLVQKMQKVIYHQTMTPSWLEAHASYIDSSRSTTTEQLTFNAGSVTDAALLKIRMIPAGLVRDSTTLTVGITVAHNVSIGQAYDSDIRYGVSDGTRFIGFETNDVRNHNDHSPCYGTTGVPGSTLTSAQQIAPLPKPSDSLYPGQYVMTLKLDEGWGSCYTAHDGGFVKTAVYNNRLMPSRGLTLEVYKRGAHERVGIKYIMVAIIQDA